ncbi:putative ABC transporter peptide-binding protein YtcQ [Paenibacillus albidus]|uniref:ABC transporter peptide-binding protein YtcQ n=1 Tax=Paenibacillus albidus TaxID=2041023 RepID=A0A917FSH0_9BACL|nr:extracellular solute-binding protein [Paenibacillus albidus]GGG01597.1 putative ABC transporter peptide-binding protein YtcQ [Paenibacillus albidus]
MKSKRKLMSAITAVLLATALAGCSGGNSGVGNEGGDAAGKPSGTDQAPGKAEAAQIKAMTILFGNPPATDNNKALEDLEKRGNVDLNVTFVPSEAYADKLSVAVSAGDSYDLLLMDGGKDDKFSNLVRMGAFYDLTPYLEKTKNIKMIEDAVWNNIKIDGKVYGIPRPRGLYGGGEASMLIRKDWLDKYNLEVPKTLDELTKALTVFKENDPAGGGKTIPLTVFGVDGAGGPGPFAGVLPIQFSFGIPNTWKLDNDTPVRDFQTPEYKTFLDWMKDSWSKGLIDKDAPVLKNQQQARSKFLAGVAGVFSGNASDIGEGNLIKLRQADPNAEIAIIDLLEGPAGDKGVAVIGGYYGLWAIPSSVPEEKVQQIVDFLDFTASEENVAFSKAGVIGVHASEFKDGVAVQTEEQLKQYDLDKPSAFVLENRVDPYVYATSKDQEILKKQKESLDTISKFGIENPFLPFSSETASKNPDSYKKMNAVMTKYVLGEGTWDNVQAEIDAWSNGTGATITQELLEQYQAEHK